jgi:hypothetical protein
MKCSGTDLIHYLNRAQSALAGCVCPLLFQCFIKQFASCVYAGGMGHAGAAHALRSGPQVGCALVYRLLTCLYVSTFHI